MWTVTDIQLPRFEMRHRLQLSLEHAGMSPTDMAAALHVHRNTVSRYLHGRGRPDYATLIVWARLTGVDFDWLEAGQASVTDKPDDHSYPRLRLLVAA